MQMERRTPEPSQMGWKEMAGWGREMGRGSLGASGGGPDMVSGDAVYTLGVDYPASSSFA